MEDLKVPVPISLFLYPLLLNSMGFVSMPCKSKQCHDPGVVSPNKKKGEETGDLKRFSV